MPLATHCRRLNSRNSVWKRKQKGDRTPCKYTGMKGVCPWQMQYYVWDYTSVSEGIHCMSFCDHFNSKHYEVFIINFNTIFWCWLFTGSVFALNYLHPQQGVTGSDSCYLLSRRKSSRQSLPYKVKMQYVYIRLHTNYSLLPCKIPKESCRQSMFFNN